MKLIFTSIALCFLSIALMGQNYTRDAGVRFGSGLRATYRQFYKEDMAVEIFFGYQNRGLKIGAMREFYKPAFTQYSGNFRLYYGYGIHAGFTYTNHHIMFNREYRYDWTFSPVFGMDGIVGVDYAFPEVPIMVSVDIKPYYEFSRNQIFYVQVFDVSFSVKYRF